MGIKLYCGVSEQVWNKHPTAPGSHACISPVYGKSEKTRRLNYCVVPNDTIVIQDSGAFSDGPTYRLSFEAALDRQITHAQQMGYLSQISHRASYDLLIDETWKGGERSKKRWSWEDAEAAVTTTIDAAKYLYRNKKTVGSILSAQGVTPQQYLDCAIRVMEYIDPETDILGLGGWCIVGIAKSLLPSFEETISLVVPEASKRGIKNIHVWGVIYADALGKLLYICNQYGIACSTDSVGPSIRPSFGSWGYADWVDHSYKRVDTSVRGLDRARHVQLVREWLANLENSKYYQAPRRLT